MMRTIALGIWMVATMLAAAPGAFAAPEAGRKIEYGRDVLPILSGACFTCHGPDLATMKGGLRLDSAEASRKELKSGSRAIVPGKVAESELIARIFAEDPDDLMPPKKSNLHLTLQQKDILKRWVEQGADYEKHWAYDTMKRPAVPQPAQTGWTRNAIDQFIFAKLESQGIKPSAEADRHAIVRRLSLDLTGLPPSIELADRFAKDARPDAYERLVDELLASPAYGEHFASTWLDLARYADSNGYAEDQARKIWRYRDWVINAINQNKPFDQFTIEQLAGDLLPNATNEQILATAFHRNTLTNTEGGTNDEEFRTAAIVDRVNTTMQVWMGVTAACAQCHDHKYDPITQEEYFKLYAILNQTQDADRGDNSPLLTETDPAEEQRKSQLLAQIGELEKVVAEKKKAIAEAAEREAAEKAAAEKEAAAKEATKNSAPRNTPAKEATAKVEPADAILTRFIRVENLGKGVWLHLAEVQAFVGADNLATKGKASQISTDYEGPAHLTIDGNTNGNYDAKSVAHTGTADNPWWEVDLGKAVPIDKIVIWNRTDNGTVERLQQWRVVAMNEKREPVWVRKSTTLINPKVDLVIPKNAKSLDAAARKELASYIKGETTTAPKIPEQDKIDQLKKEIAALKGVTTPVMRELAANQRRKTHIIIRGDFLSLGNEVQPGTPAIFPPLPTGATPDRLALARWIVAPENPLTARVAVNRYWELLLGHGLVETPDDFGVRGGLPNHPQLLDWLATEFIAQNWDVKKLIKMIVTSATYRQASNATTAQIERDPDNKLFGRGPRFRQTAEMVRDQALMVSGLLSTTIGGPSVRPPRPKLGLSAAFGPSTDWTDSGGADRHRRGLYTEWRRSSPYPSMTTFDATPRTVCTIRRPRTNTPLQALVTMNDPVYVEAAQALARRMMNEGGATVESKAAHGFRLALIRPPTDAEVKRLASLYQQARENYAKVPAEAKTFATVPIGELPQGVDAIDAAAWTLVGNVILNLDETMSKR